jgi:hypothetical protein
MEVRAVLVDDALVDGQIIMTLVDLPQLFVAHMQTLEWSSHHSLSDQSTVSCIIKLPSLSICLTLHVNTNSCIFRFLTTKISIFCDKTNYLEFFLRNRKKKLAISVIICIFATS